MKANPILAAMCILLLSASAAHAQEGEAMQAPELDVAEIVITSQVTDRMPVDSMMQVGGHEGTVYCWTRIVGAEGETYVEHVWYRTDQEMARVQLNVAGPNWRTWSSKRIEPAWAGDWRVDVVGPDGTVLESISFAVVEGSPSG